MQYMFTFYDTQKQYMPVSTVITVKPHEKFSEMKSRATAKLMIDKGWSVKDLTEKYHYSKIRFKKLEK